MSARERDTSAVAAGGKALTRHAESPGMRVTCEVVGEATHDLELAPDATYADVLAAVDLSPQEATVVVDDSPVPEDRPVDADADSVRVLRLIKGG